MLEEIQREIISFLDRYSIERAGPEAPVRFVREVLGVEPDAWQLEVLRAYGRGDRRISVRSGHGVGKSTVAAWISTHQLVTRHPQKTVVTAPSSPQLFDVLFAEIKVWMGKLPPGLQSLFEVKADRIERVAAPSASFITARTSRPDQPEAIAGIHSEHVLLICDEASGIPEKVFEAGSGSMSGHTATTLLMGNPVRSSGLFYDTHHKLRDKWFTMKVSCEDSPRVSQDFIDDMLARYGERSNAFRVRVLGEFPLADDDTVIPFELVESAQQRDVKPNPKAPMIWGLDVARFGDDETALCKRRMNTVALPVQTWRNLDLMQTVGRVKLEYDTTPLDERPVSIDVDAIGLGAGVADRLRELGLPARAVNVSESSAFTERFINLRAQLWWDCRDWLAKLDVKLPADEKLAAQLIGPRYQITSSGKIKVEGKEDMKKRGMPSPNAADALILTFATNAGTVMHGSTNRQAPIRRNLKGVV